MVSITHWIIIDQGIYFCCCSLSHVRLMDCSMPGFSVHHQLPKLAQAHVHWVGDTIQPSHPLSAPFPPALDLSQHQGLFQWISSSHQVDKVLEFQLQHQSFQWILYWFPLGWTGLISLLSKWLSRIFSSTTVWKYQFFGAQLSLWSNSHFWLTTGKTIALTIETFVGKVLSLLFNPLSRFVIAFFPRSKHLLISWLQSPSTVILEPKKIKSITVSIVSPPICHEVMEPCMDVRVGLWRKLSTKELMLLNCGVGEDSWESLGLQGDPTSPFWRRSALGFLWKDWC